MNQKNDKVKKPFWSKERCFQISALLFTIAISVVTFINGGRVSELAPYGYIGVFLISVVSCSSIVLPVPGLIAVTAMGAVLNPILVGFVSGIGGTIGETTGYLLGYGGRIVTEDSEIYTRIVGWMKKWGDITIFLLALTPNPLFDVAGAAAGVLRFPFWRFLLVGAAGRILKNILFAHFGAWGAQFLSF